VAGGGASVPLAGDGQAVPVVLHADGFHAPVVVGYGDAADPGVAAVVPRVSPGATPWPNFHQLLRHHHLPLMLLLPKRKEKKISLGYFQI